jgi:hypothetical protein
MKKQIQESIRFDDPSEIIYWSKKWEISAMTLFRVFEKIKSNKIDQLKDFYVKTVLHYNESKNIFYYARCQG